MSRRNGNQVLQRLIRIKKQRAEQQLSQIQAEQLAIDRKMQALEQSFLQGGGGAEKFDDWVIAVQNRYPERVLRELENLRHRRKELDVEISNVERSLKTSLHASRQLRGAKA